MRAFKNPLYAFCLLLSFSAQAFSTPYIPATGSEVLERLPSRNDPVQREFQRLRLQLAANPNNLPAALSLSRRYIEMWRDGGDPRYLSYAQATLGPWWKLAHPPADAQVMRATILQSTHQFNAALADIDAVLKADPDNAQAWLIRATILQVLGQYQPAKLSCAHLYGSAQALVAQTCLWSVASLNGQAGKSYQQLEQVYQATPHADPSIKLWAATVLAEISVRRGDMGAARTHFEQALATGTPDNYLLAAYADFLLAQHQPEKVVALLKPKIQVDTLLLRYALALQALNADDAKKYIAMLAQRFEAAKMRGDTIHQREQARFELELMHNPATALKVAQQNWAVQKEPADTLLLLQAALAANDKHAAKPVLEWLRETKLEDQALAPLIAQLDD